MEALERAGALDEMLEAAGALGVQEALIESVVEVLHRAVVPRFARRDEDGRDPPMQAHPHDLAKAGRREEWAPLSRAAGAPAARGAPSFDAEDVASAVG